MKSGYNIPEIFRRPARFEFDRRNLLYKYFKILNTTRANLGYSNLQLKYASNGGVWTMDRCLKDSIVNLIINPKRLCFQSCRPLRATCR